MRRRPPEGVRDVGPWPLAQPAERRTHLCSTAGHTMAAVLFLGPVTGTGIEDGWSGSHLPVGCQPRFAGRASRPGRCASMPDRRKEMTNTTDTAHDGGLPGTPARTAPLDKRSPHPAFLTRPADVPLRGRAGRGAQAWPADFHSFATPPSSGPLYPKRMKYACLSARPLSEVGSDVSDPSWRVVSGRG